MTPRIFIVRQKLHGAQWPSFPAKVDVRVKGVFASRGEADACHQRAEREAARSNNWYPLTDMAGLTGLLEVSNFDEGLLLDWLLDHDIPHPSTVGDVGNGEDPWMGWLMS